MGWLKKRREQRRLKAWERSCREHEERMKRLRANPNYQREEEERQREWEADTRRYDIRRELIIRTIGSRAYLDSGNRLTELKDIQLSGSQPVYLTRGKSLLAKINGTLDDAVAVLDEIERETTHRQGCRC